MQDLGLGSRKADGLTLECSEDHLGLCDALGAASSL